MAEQKFASRVVRQLRGGQITIPAAFRRRLGIEQDALLRITIEDNELRIRPLERSRSAGDASWFNELYQVFGPVRDEAGEMSDEEINTAIDRAVAEVRSGHA